MKKYGLCVLGLLLLVAATASAGGRQEAVTVQSAEFEMWTTQTQSDRVSNIQLLIDTFTALNPGIEINLVPVDENDLPAQVAASAAAGTLPALGEGGSENAISFGAEGLLDMEANTDFIKSIGKNRFYQGTLKILESPTRGQYYAVPYHGWIQGIWYRKDWFADAGFDAPEDWDSIEKAAKHFYQPDKNQYGILVGTKAEVFSEQVFTQFAISNNARLFDKEGNLIFNSPRMKEALEYYARIAKYNPPGPQTWRARDYYIQGKMAMFFYSTYIMDDLALAEVAAGSLTGENFQDLKGASFDTNLVANTAFAPKISKRQPASYGVVVTYALYNQEDKNKTAAAGMFLDYLFTEDAYISYVHMQPGGMNPVLKEIAENEKFLNDPNKVYERYGKDKIAQIVSGLENIQRFGIVDGNLIEAYGKIFTQQIIPQLIFKITQEGEDVQKAMDWAEGEMKKVVQ
jgi:multiple sugar transport system substrate-binding protein